MKRGLILAIWLILMGLTAVPAQAKVMTLEKGTVVVEEDQVIDDDLYIAGETVEILGTINGDVYAAGGVVRFSGKTTGDLVIAAGEVRVSGEVNDDLWIGAGNVNLIKATIGDGATIGAGSVTIDNESVIDGSLVGGAGMLDLSAPIGRNLMAGAGQIRLNAPVGKEMRVGAESIELGRDTRIGGDLTYVSQNELTIVEGATVAGETRRTEGQYANRREWEQKSAEMKRGMWAGMNILSYLGAMVVGLAMLWLGKKPVLLIATQIQANLLPALGWGLLVLVLSGPAILMLVMTGIGVPLALIGMVLLLIDFYLAKIFASLALGQTIQKQFGWKKMQVGWVYLLGLTAYYALRMIPLVGMLVRLIAFLAGVGGVAIVLRRRK